MSLKRRTEIISTTSKNEVRDIDSQRKASVIAKEQAYFSQNNLSKLTTYGQANKFFVIRKLTTICFQAQTANIFSRLHVLRLKRRVCRWRRECYRSANVAAILGVKPLFHS